MSRKRVPLNQNECTDDFRIGVPFEQNLQCCASLLHLALSEIQIFLLKAEKFLNKNGIVYVSFKYGTCQEIRKGRYYTDLTEESLEKMISKLHQLEVAEMFRSSDVLRDRKQQWLNAILKKVDNKYLTKNLE